MTVEPDAPYRTADLVSFLERRRIATRLLFGGNLTRHSACGEGTYRVASYLVNADLVMRNLWIGVYPGVNKVMTDNIIGSFQEFVRDR